MKGIILGLLGLLSFNVQAADCLLMWDANPAEERVIHYNIYKDGQLFAESVQDNSFPFICAEGSYAVTAVNILGESDMSSAASLVVPTTPKNVIINITIN